MLRLRAATLADLDTLRRWDEEPHVVESEPNDDERLGFVFVEERDFGAGHCAVYRLERSRWMDR